MNWDAILDVVTPYVVRIETPGGMGTGFIYLYNEDKSICGIATAAHVIEEAEAWQQPIRIIHPYSESVILLRVDERQIDSLKTRDSAVILFPKVEEFPIEVPPLRPIERPLVVGTEVGWLGFPGIESETLCFFSGNVSARKLRSRTYLLDGVVINGVSGGPVFWKDGDTVEIVGIITAYQPNWQSAGEALPGLCYARDVSHFHETHEKVTSLDAIKRGRGMAQDSGGETPAPVGSQPPEEVV